MHKAHWDGKKEYEKFWAGRKKYPVSETNNPKPKKRGPWAILIVAIVIIIGAAAFFLPEKRSEAIDSTYSQGIDDHNTSAIPEYSGEDYIVLNNNVPNFSEKDMELPPCEEYSDLDSLGRCGPAFAVLTRSMMPTEEREGIGQIKPTGWNQNKYEGIVDSTPPYLYNRCHLIAYALAGENANEKNLITGTRYFNATAMLPFEIMVMEYLDNSDNRVLYRVTPHFKDNELLARGVEIEAYSVEDNGEGVCFHVFVYNHQPGIYIDYTTGQNRLATGNE